MNEPTDTLLLLSDALMDWSAPELVEEIRKQERLCTPRQLEFQGLPRLVTDDELRHPTGDGNMEPRNPAVAEWRAAWESLEWEFRNRIRAGDLHLSGVLVKPELTATPRPISSAWAFEFEFDLFADAVTIAHRRFADVRVSKLNLVVAVVSPARPAGRLPPITPENLRDLTDDEVLLLLSDHAERVVRSKDGALIHPGKVTLLPIVRSKMRYRSDMGELLGTLTAECLFLSKWIADKAAHNFSTPKPKTIGKVLGKEYALLNPRSNAAIQKLKS